MSHSTSSQGFSQNYRYQQRARLFDFAVKEEEYDGAQRDLENRIQNFDPRSRASQRNVIAIPDDQEEALEQKLLAGIHVDLDDDDVVPYRANPSNRAFVRNQPLDPASCSQEYVHSKMVLKKDTCVEVIEVEGKWRISFVKIQAIYRTPGGAIFIRGLPFTRTRNLRGQLPRMRNELCMILEIDMDDDRPDLQQALIDIPVTNIIQKRKLECTNADFAQNRCLDFFPTVEAAEEQGLLMCRWKHRLVYKNASFRAQQNAQEFAFEHLEDCTKRRYRVPQQQRLNNWRGGKVRGGSHVPGQAHEHIVVDLNAEAQDMPQDAQQEQWIDAKPGQKYTFGDLFCGGGGTSCGARMAGLRVDFGCDINKAACETYRTNFPEARLFEMDTFDFITDDDLAQPAPMRVDLLHLSPPCQFWSPAHTSPGKNDEANIAVLYSCHELIKKLRPRIFTVEQTFGILYDRFEHYFNAMIHGFTMRGYSVRWKVVWLWNWGLPSRRRRLIMIGSCPGEALPPFPKNTHSEHPQPGTLPFVTVAQSLSRIPQNAARDDPLHQLGTIRHFNPPKHAWNPHAPLNRTITTSGANGTHHPDGFRNFSKRELATLQGFPVHYLFSRDAGRQIGNAFPPCVVKVLMAHIKGWLEKVDKVRPVSEVVAVEEGAQEYITIDDAEDEVKPLQDDDANEDFQWLGTNDLPRPSSSKFSGANDLSSLSSSKFPGTNDLFSPSSSNSSGSGLAGRASVDNEVDEMDIYYEDWFSEDSGSPRGFPKTNAKKQKAPQSARSQSQQEIIDLTDL